MSEYALNRLEYLWVDNLAVGSSYAGPSSSIDNDDVKAAAGIDASKLDHHYRAHFGQGGTASATTFAIHLSRGTGTITGFRCGSVVACTGNATITVDCKKNGTTILSSPVTLDSANAAYTPEAGTVSVTSCADGDVFTVEVTVNEGTGALGTGLYAALDVDEPYPA